MSYVTCDNRFGHSENKPITAYLRTWTNVPPFPPRTPIPITLSPFLLRLTFPTTCIYLLYRRLSVVLTCTDVNPPEPEPVVRSKTPLSCARLSPILQVNVGSSSLGARKDRISTSVSWLCLTEKVFKPIIIF